MQILCLPPPACRVLHPLDPSSAMDPGKSDQDIRGGRAVSLPILGGGPGAAVPRRKHARMGFQRGLSGLLFSLSSQPLCFRVRWGTLARLCRPGLLPLQVPSPGRDEGGMFSLCVSGNFLARTPPGSFLVQGRYDPDLWFCVLPSAWRACDAPPYINDARRCAGLDFFPGYDGKYGDVHSGPPMCL